MTDLSRIFGFGQRSRNSSTLTTAALLDDPPDPGSSSQFTQPEPHKPQQQHSRHSRPNTVSRISSYLSLGGSKDGRAGRTPSPSIDMTETLERASQENHSKEMQMLIQERDRVWHNPSLIQMIESLQVAMMSAESSLTPIPVQYNSHVLHLIEGFSKQQQKLEDARIDVEEVVAARERDLQQFSAMSEEWIEREKQYKAEILRLEKLLARHSADGMQTVALARSDTLVDRKDTRRFIAKIRRVSGGGGAGRDSCSYRHHSRAVGLTTANPRGTRGRRRERGLYAAPCAGQLDGTRDGRVGCAIGDTYIPSYFSVSKTD